MAHALLSFQSRVSGSIGANWAATARTIDLSFEISGTKGALAFSQGRMNEMLLLPGHHLGFNGRNVIEVAALLRAFARAEFGYPVFRGALAIQETVEAIRRPSDARCWKSVTLD